MVWWIKQFGIAVASLFFLALGIDTLYSAYQLNHPHEFIMVFFSASLIILVSAVGLLWPLIRIYHRLKPPSRNDMGKDGTSA
jgi:fucose 4-O-acetylase-like acetyltransferase